MSGQTSDPGLAPVPFESEAESGVREVAPAQPLPPTAERPPWASFPLFTGEDDAQLSPAAARDVADCSSGREAEPSPTPAADAGCEQVPLEAYVSEDEPELVESTLVLEPVSALLSAGDTEDLRVYLRTGGFGVFEHSPFGAMLNRAEMFAKVARPCLRCGGDRKRWIGGTGFVSRDTGKSPTEPSAKQKEWMALLDIELPPALGDTLCGDCKGRGWGMPRSRSQGGGAITARPMGSSIRQQAGVEMDVADLARLGRVSAMLNAVRATSIVSWATLEVAFAPHGTERSAGWHITPAGHKMLKTNPQKLPPAQFFANERASQAADPKPNRKALFDAAETQWVAQLEQACRLWNECKAERPHTSARWAREPRRGSRPDGSGADQAHAEGGRA